MIGSLIDGIIQGALDAARVLLMSREQERRWMNSDRGDRRPTYAPPITRHHRPWPDSGGRNVHQERPYRRWPGDDR
jgi:hypothetical protein